MDFPTPFQNLRKSLSDNFIEKVLEKYRAEKKKNSLVGDGEFHVIEDFSENYSLDLQDITQSSNWNNFEATIHSFLVNHKGKAQQL